MDMRQYYANIDALRGTNIDGFDNTVICLFATWLSLQGYTLPEGLARLDSEYRAWLEQWGIPERGAQRQVEFLRERGQEAAL